MQWTTLKLALGKLSAGPDDFCEPSRRRFLVGLGIAGSLAVVAPALLTVGPADAAEPASADAEEGFDIAQRREERRRREDHRDDRRDNRRRERRDDRRRERRGRRRMGRRDLERRCRGDRRFRRENRRLCRRVTGRRIGRSGACIDFGPLTICE
ncbi:hypothetical protein LCGC14_0647310 [marine sediment metagenome]